MTDSPSLSPAPASVDELEDRLSEPTSRLVAALAGLSGDIMFLGVGGKMGPTMARMARRASDLATTRRKIIGVSRFSSPDARQKLEDAGVETIVCDLLDETALAALPDAANVISMTGFKFGASQSPATAWGMNCFLGGVIGRRFRGSRIAAFSTGNVYPLVPATGGGSVETDPPRPIGEYATTALGRERMFEFMSARHGTPLVLLRLNYATEMRYGVLVDLCRQVWEGRPIDVSMGYVNVIWQRDASVMALESLLHAAAPPKIINIAGPEILSVRAVCEEFGRLLGKTVEIVGSESPDALLNNGSLGHELLGRPSVSAEQLIRWTADWVARGGESLGKPTHFEARDGKF